MFEQRSVPLDERWSVLCGKEDEFHLRAAELLVEGLSEYISEYTLEVRFSNEEQLRGNLILVGAGVSNPKICEYVGEEDIQPQGYRLKVFHEAEHNNRQVVIIHGGDERGMLYGCVDFLYQYLPKADYDFTLQPQCYIHRLLDAKCGEPKAMLLPETDIVSAPEIERRGIWSWGHVIYNYRGFLDNMLKLKMNEVIVWNDYKPLNGKEFVDYAHRNGIEVVWGFSWAWGVDIDISKPGEMEKWKDIVVAQYRDLYADMNGDGVYFQTFTETSDDVKDGLVIAEEAVKWVNYISDALLKQYPALHIQFGLHATSVAHRMEVIARTDPRVEIIWEDCGAFPYAYASNQIDDFDKTVDFTEQMVRQREGCRCGAVLKGMMRLDWINFEYKTGPFVLGCAGEGFRKKRTAYQKRYWHYIQCDWLVYGDYCRRILKQLADGCEGRANVTFLVEDGMFEEEIWYPVALAAEMLWNPGKTFAELTQLAARRQDVVFA